MSESRCVGTGRLYPSLAGVLYREMVIPPHGLPQGEALKGDLSPFRIRMSSIVYEPVIGLEVHAQLLTSSKMFCPCSTQYVEAPPNTYVCPVCMGMPGVLPVINRKAVEYTIMMALALNCSVAPHTKFDRKNYPYPDLMKGYQISQYDTPISHDGWLDIEVDGEKRRVGITRVHLEEDVAKLFHRAGPDGEAYSLLDVNRAGVPLMEIVSQPDLRSPEEARLYLIKLRTMLRYLGVSSGNMEDGTFRCDANISLRPEGVQELYTRVEVKNMNSFRSVLRALQFEQERQTHVLAQGGKIVQETRGWVEEKGITVSQRSKEYAHDYRYFPEPDLPPLAIDSDLVRQIRAKLPELPDARRARFLKQYGLPPYDAALLAGSKSAADFFEETLEQWKGHAIPLENKAKSVSNWMLTDLGRLVNLSDVELDRSRVAPARLAELLELVESGQISGTAGKTVLEEMFNTGKSPRQIVQERELTQINDSSALGRVAEEMIAANPQAVADYKGGKQQALAFLVGQVMKATRGRANPGLVNSVLKEKLERVR